MLNMVIKQGFRVIVIKQQKELSMQEVKREQLNLVQIAKRQNIPYGKLYHTYLVLGSLPEAVKFCRKG